MRRVPAPGPDEVVVPLRDYAALCRLYEAIDLAALQEAIDVLRRVDGTAADRLVEAVETITAARAAAAACEPPLSK